MAAGRWHAFLFWASPACIFLHRAASFASERSSAMHWEADLDLRCLLHALLHASIDAGFPFMRVGVTLGERAASGLTMITVKTFGAHDAKPCVEPGGAQQARHSRLAEGAGGQGGFLLLLLLLPLLLLLSW